MPEPRRQSRLAIDGTDAECTLDVAAEVKGTAGKGFLVLDRMQRRVTPSLSKLADAGTAERSCHLDGDAAQGESMKVLMSKGGLSENDGPLMGDETGTSPSRGGVKEVASRRRWRPWSSVFV